MSIFNIPAPLLAVKIPLLQKVLGAKRRFDFFRPLAFSAGWERSAGFYIENAYAHSLRNLIWTLKLMRTPRRIIWRVCSVYLFGSLGCAWILMQLTGLWISSYTLASKYFLNWCSNSGKRAETNHRFPKIKIVLLISLCKHKCCLHDYLTQQKITFNSELSIVVPKFIRNSYLLKLLPQF